MVWDLMWRGEIKPLRIFKNVLNQTFLGFQVLRVSSLDAFLCSNESLCPAEERRRAGVFQRTLAYPLALLLLLALTGTAVVIVGLNTLQLLVGIKALPLASAPAILGEAQQGKVGHSNFHIVLCCQIHHFILFLFDMD